MSISGESMFLVPQDDETVIRTSDYERNESNIPRHASMEAESHALKDHHTLENHLENGYIAGVFTFEKCTMFENEVPYPLRRRLFSHVRCLRDH